MNRLPRGSKGTHGQGRRARHLWSAQRGRMHPLILLVALAAAAAQDSTLSRLRAGMVSWRTAPGANAVEVNVTRYLQRSSFLPEVPRPGDTVHVGQLSFGDGSGIRGVALNVTSVDARADSLRAVMLIRKEYRSAEPSYQLRRSRMPTHMSTRMSTHRYELRFSGCCRIDNLVHGSGASYSLWSVVTTKYPRSRVYTDVCTHVYAHVDTRIYARFSAHVYTHVYTHVYAHAYTHVYAQVSRS